MKSDKENQTRAVSCPICGGEIDLRQSEEEIAECPYCGNTFARADLLRESDAVRTERIRAKAYLDAEKRRQELEKQKQELERQRLKFEQEESERKEHNRKSEAFRHSRQRKLAIFLLVNTIIFGFCAFYSGAAAAGLLGILISILYVLCLLTGSQTIREKHRGMHTLYFVLALVLAIPFWYAYDAGINSADAQPYSWEDISLHSRMPQPPSDRADIGVNTDSYLSIDIYNITQEECSTYMSSCKEMGFTRDMEQYGNDHLNTFDEDGYHLLLNYYEDDKKMSILLKAPEKMTQIAWPQSALAQTIPQPASLQGSIQEDRSDYLAVHIGDTSKDDFNDYIDACSQAGYSVDYNRSDKYYTAYNEDGHYLSIKYMGADVMSVELSEKHDDG
ncbi:MAG: DUF6591 domain-containing protein [Lachnospiraceae bacterium]|jgi:ribosomal protein L37AE/L43A